MDILKLKKMDFGSLVKYYEKIGHTTKRLEMTDYLVELFRELKDNPERAKDLEKIIYLTQGILYPEIMEQPKLGLAEKLLLEALSKYYALNLDKIEKILTKTGDLGTTAEKLAKRQITKKNQITSFMGMESKSVSVAEIYEKLEEIAAISGDGSQDKKYSKLTWLFARCNPVMIKYLMRIITSTMRVGVSEPTIMDALAIAYLRDKGYRENIERSYNIHPDLGYVARHVYEKGLKGFDEIEIQLGMPIRMMLASRLEYRQILPKLGGEKFFSEYKLDGERLQIHKDGDKVEIFSRRLKKITDQYPDVIESVLKNIRAEKAILEGEAVAMDAFYEEMQPFQVLITRKRKYDIDEMVEKVPVCLFVFDLLYLNDGDSEEIVMDLPFLERRSLIEEILNQTEKIKLVEGRMISSTPELVEWFKEARSKNTEGVMNKSIDPDKSMYKAGNRGFIWIKLKSLDAGKMSDTIDVVPIGALWGKGRRANTYGTLLVGVLNTETQKFELLTRVASGFSDDNLSEFMDLFKKYEISHSSPKVVCSEKADVWFKPSIVMEIAGDELTVSPKADAGKYYDGKMHDNGYSVRFPVFQRIRKDKGVREVTTVKEIINLYENQ